MCRATVSPTSGRNDSVAYPGMPPVRSGHMVPSSARHRHRKQPRTVITPIRRMPSAPVPATTKGAMPVTRIVPARPMTNAPHQFVPLTRPFSGMSPSTVDIAPPFQPKVSLEERQVTLHFPVTDDGVPGLELLALDLRVVVDVVAVWRLAQRLAQHVVGDQRVGRVQEGRRQGPDPTGGDLLGRHYVQVVAVGLARVQAAIDPVEARGQLRG